MLAVYFSLPRAAWQKVTVKSSRHARSTDSYFVKAPSSHTQGHFNLHMNAAPQPMPKTGARTEPHKAAHPFARAQRASSHAQCYEKHECPQHRSPSPDAQVTAMQFMP